jgi:hypothetical protein
MSTKLFKNGSKKYKSYMKPVGKGFEVGFLCGTKSLFVGNFVHKSEATQWYQKMNAEYSHFSKKFWHNPKAGAATAFYHKFITHNLYKHYYDFLDKCFGKYTKTFQREYSRDVRTYHKLKKSWTEKGGTPWTRRSA